ncbi:hypothetical protein K2173_014412 [Erythroxylum novogranatense]|uniref:Uncharacterized protein n=1 Tax=Erythroxylum novogranatense TaxID=1862640 RepID=A0AAV8S523_9ROSI|nr:hypothetical protein K2173_014412 [Erythroxylum novogranatense]
MSMQGGEIQEDGQTGNQNLLNLKATKEYKCLVSAILIKFDKNVLLPNMTKKTPESSRQTTSFQVRSSRDGHHVEGPIRVGSYPKCREGESQFRKLDEEGDETFPMSLLLPVYQLSVSSGWVHSQTPIPKSLHPPSPRDFLSPEVAGSTLSSNPKILTVLASKIFSHLFPNCTLFQYYYIRR